MNLPTTSEIPASTLEVERNNIFNKINCFLEGVRNYESIQELSYFVKVGYAVEAPCFSSSMSSDIAPVDISSSVA